MYDIEGVVKRTTILKNNPSQKYAESRQDLSAAEIEVRRGLLGVGK